MATFPTFHCVHKERDKNNVITLYTLKDLSNNKFCDIEPDRLKKLLRNRSIYVDNLKLTSDNKIIDNNKESDNLLNKYIESCKILGVKPLNIKYEQGKYIVVDIPKDTSIIIPQFVDAVCMKKELSGHIEIKCNTDYNVKSNEEILNILKRLSSKTDKIIDDIDEIDDRTEDILENQKRESIKSSKELDEIKNELDSINTKFDNIPTELCIITDYIKGLTSKQIEDNIKLQSLADALAGTVLEDANKYFLQENRILNNSLIPEDSRVLKTNSNMLINKVTYESCCKSLKGTMIPYEKTGDILPYLNYAANMYEEIYNRLLIEFDINGDKSPENIKHTIDLISNSLNYIISACIISSAFVAAPVVTGAGAALVGFTALNEAKDSVKDAINEVGSVTFAHNDWESERKHSKKSLNALRYIDKNFPDLQDMANIIKNYLDKEIFIFAMETIVLASTDSLICVNKDGFYNRPILKVLYRLRAKEAINYKELEIAVKASYLAACMYVNENCRFSNDFDLDYIHKIVSKSPTFNKMINLKTGVNFSKLDNEQKQIYIRQQYYYAFVVEYFKVALCQCNIKQQIVDMIIQMFIEEASFLGMGPADITKEDFLRPGSINIKHKVYTEIEYLYK